MKVTKFSITMVAPVGKFSPKETKIPPMTDTTPTREEMRREALKPLETCKEVTAGRMRSAEVNRIPTAFIVSTTVTAVRRNRIVFILRVLIPVALADSSSNVMDTRS
jgi:hypothetical protein